MIECVKIFPPNKRIGFGEKLGSFITAYSNSEEFIAVTPYIYRRNTDIKARMWNDRCKKATD